MTFTGKFIKPICPRGHDKRITGRGNHGECKVCVLAKSKAWREKDIHRYKRIVNNSRWKTNGIVNDDGSDFTQSDYNRHFQIQGGSCKGCGTHQAEQKSAMCADHDHATGKFRGLLCYACNYILGMASDDPAILENLKNYLTKETQK